MNINKLLGVNIINYKFCFNKNKINNLLYFKSQINLAFKISHNFIIYEDKNNNIIYGDKLLYRNEVKFEAILSS